MIFTTCVLISVVHQSKLRDFEGFVPDQKTALAVARPIYSNLLGSDYLDSFSTVMACEYRGYWVIKVSNQKASLGESAIVEPFSLVINSWTCNIESFGRNYNVQLGLAKLPKIKTRSISRG
jgi:hypothetical protein